MVTVMSGFWSPMYVSCFRFKYNDRHCIYRERKMKHAWIFWGLTFRGPGDSFVCIRERGVQGGMRWRERCSSFLFIMTNFVYSIKIYKFTMRNKYHCGHHAMQISIHAPPYNFVMLYTCRNSNIIFGHTLFKRNVVCEINVKRGLFRSMGYVM